MHYQALAGIVERNSALARTQNQIADGRRIQTPADDPAGAVRALDIDRSLAESAQYGRNASIAANRLTLEEQAFADATNLLQRVRDLTVQANTATVDQSTRQSIVAEIDVRLRELVDLGNRRDANGEYLFSGFSTLTQPFAQTAGGVSYVGDQGVRELQTSPSQRVPDGHSGFEVFLDVGEGNGTFVTGVNPANTGTAIIDGGSVTNPSAWVPDNYTLRFTSATAWEVVDGTSTVVTTGTYASPTTISFNGVQVNVEGQVATGDEFTIRQSTTQDMFTTFANLLDAMRASTASGSGRAIFTTRMGTALQQLDRALDHVSGVRAEVGARLSVLETGETSRMDRELELNSALSELRDLDYAEAVTRLNLQLIGLEAAQSSYSKISQLSLFDYL